MREETSCAPCILRECPIDHRCMTRVGVDRVADAALELGGVSTRKRPAIFMDRDGTLSHEVGYVNHPSRFRLYPWTADAVRAINSAGWLAVVVTNQAGVARGYFPESVFDEVQQLLLERSRRAGRGSTRSTRACTTRGRPPPYRRTATAASPGPGMLRSAQTELGADLASSWVIGDRHSDLQLAWNVGAEAPW